jgi:hypothetical protein
MTQFDIVQVMLSDWIFVGEILCGVHGAVYIIYIHPCAVVACAFQKVVLVCERSYYRMSANFQPENAALVIGLSICSVSRNQIRVINPLEHSCICRIPKCGNDSTIQNCVGTP